MAELARQWDEETGVYDVGKEIGVALKIEKENTLDSGKGKILKGIREQSSKTITALYLKPHNPGRDQQVCQRLIFFGEERVERTEWVERGGDGERTGAGRVFNMCEGGETGADLAV